MEWDFRASMFEWKIHDPSQQKSGYIKLYSSKSVIFMTAIFWSENFEE